MRWLFATALALLALTGCSFERNGTVHHVIIGFGIVSVPKTNEVAEIARIRALGVYAGNLPTPTWSAGFLSSTIVTVKQTNAILEIK